MNLYGFVGNDGIGRADYLGRLTFTVEKFKEVVIDLGVVPTSVIPGDAPTLDVPPPWAITGVTWTIRSKCKCDKNDGKWYLWDTIIKMNAVVLMRITYPDKATMAWVREKEQDHVADFNWWGRNEGRQAAQVQENRQCKIAFEKKAACESEANDKMQNALRQSAREEVNQTIDDYDTPGTHTGP